MSDNQDTQTAKNLMAAFIGESQARNRYTMFTKIARKEGYELIAGIFEETANHEAEHAKLNYRMLVEDLGINGAEITIEVLIEKVLRGIAEDHSLIAIHRAIVDVDKPAQDVIRSAGEVDREHGISGIHAIRRPSPDRGSSVKQEPLDLVLGETVREELFDVAGALPERDVIELLAEARTRIGERQR